MKANGILFRKDIHSVFDAGYATVDPPELARDYLDYEWLSLSDEQFDGLAAGIKEFWAAFPERLFLQGT